MLEIKDSGELLENLKADKAASDNQKASWDAKREVWISEGNGEKYGNEVEGKSSIVDRSIKETEVWQHSVIIDPFVSNSDMVRCTPVGGTDRPITVQSEALLNHFFCRDFDRYNFISEGFKIYQREGTVIARVGWEFAEQEVDVDIPITKKMQVPGPQGMQIVEQVTGYRTETQTRTVVNRPTAVNRDNKTLWVDPTEKQNISKAQFVIEHFKSSKSKLKQEGIYENLDKLDVKQDAYDDEDESYNDSNTGDFTFKDDARAELDVYEYWGNYDVNDDGIAEAIVCTWVGNTIIRLEENPYPDQEVPYVSAAADAEPFSINGRPNADLQSSGQKIATSIKRSLMDTLDSSTNGQRGFKEGTLDPANERKFKAKKDFKYQGEQPQIWEGKYAEFNQSVLSFYEMNRQSQADLTGSKPFAGGSGQMGSVAQAGMAMGAVAKREVDISRNFSENFVVPLLRKWLAMCNEFMEPEEIERITEAQYVQPDPVDMDGSVDVRIEVSTAETDAAKASDISFMLQTMSASLPFELTKILLAEQAELKKMPGLAKKVMEYQPQPDPKEEMKKDLEIQELQASVAEKQSRAQENQVDMQLKQAKTVVEQARARQIHAQADGTDQDFVDKTTGVSHNREMELQGQKIGGDLAKQNLANQKQMDSVRAKVGA